MHQVQNMAHTGQSPEVWATHAGMNWTIESSEVRYVAGAGHVGALHTFPEQKVLYRSDTKTPLSVVSARYQVVQPREILEFYRDLTEVGGFELETAGVLREGRKFWALARTGQNAILKGRDRMDGYLLLATTSQFTSVRVVCNNTLQIARGDSTGAVKVPHRSTFDAPAVKRQLGIAVSSWDAFMARTKAMTEHRVSSASAAAFLRRVLTYPAATTGERDAVTVNERAIKTAGELYAGKGQGAGLASASGTVWGLLNAVTEFVDHHRRARSDDHRRDAAWFGSGATIKQKAWDEAVKLVA